MTTDAGEPIQDSASGWSTFRRDLGASVEAIGRAPWLIVLTVLLAVAVFLADNPLIGIPVVIFQVGFFGTLRVGFARAYRGEAVSNHEIVSLTTSLAPRFAILGIPILILFAPLELLIEHTTGPAAVIAAILFFVALDVALTFVVPALALTTRSVTEAWQIGLAMIRDAWPLSAWYVLAPGLTLTLASNFVAYAYRPNEVLQITLVVSTAILALLFKGAIVAFYVRQPASEPWPDTWQASDGRWYPDAAHPRHRGWRLADDGHWYPPRPHGLPE